MRRVKFMSVFVLLALLLSALPGAALAQEPPPVGPYANGPAPPQPAGWWERNRPYRWEYVEGGHWLAVWNGYWCSDQHYLPGDWQTCPSGHGCIGSWTWWIRYPESKLGVPSHWRSIWPGAKDLGNYEAYGYFH